MPNQTRPNNNCPTAPPHAHPHTPRPQSRTPEQRWQAEELAFLIMALPALVLLLLRWAMDATTQRIC